MTMSRRGTIVLWIVAMAACAVIVSRTRVATDMTAFLPRSPSAAQEVLVDQVRNGAASRLILLGMDDAPAEALAMISRAMAKRLAGEPAFLAVNNGETGAVETDRAFFWRNRYLLSPDVAPGRFTVAGLHRALEKDLRLLGSDLAVLIKNSLPGDPTGEMLGLVDRLAGATRPHAHEGVWFSADERRAVLVVQTRDAGFDIDAQQRALGLIRTAFDRARQDVPGAAKAHLLETGPGVFAVRTRATIEGDATRLSLLATVVVASLMLFAYRSPRLLFLGLLPVASGAVAGIASVALGFGFVHGITLGFGVTLIGESVDYPIYLLTQTAPGGSAEDTLARIWPTLRLGVITSIAGFSAMLFSSFTGFAQLGLFSIIGLVVAVSVTRWVLPALLPRNFSTGASEIFALPLLLAMSHARALRMVLALLMLGAAALLAFHRGGFWQQDLSSLSPIPAGELRLDRELRGDLGALDLRYLLVVNAADEQQALTESERLSGVLATLVAQTALSGFDAPTAYLPSLATQRARQAALPDTDTLRGRLQQALAGMPFRTDLFAPFLRDVAAAKAAPPLTRDDLPRDLALKLDSLLYQRRGGWTTMLPLRGVADAPRVAAAVAALGKPEIAFVDLKGAADHLLQHYQHEAVTLALIGGLVIIVLLAASLRSARRVLVTAAPLAAAVTATAALLTADAQKLSIFNLVGLLLIVAVGSNYCLFFERMRGEDAHRERAIASLALANLSTVVGFGSLSFSGVPVLHDIGMAVAIGAVFSLFFAAILSAEHGFGEAVRNGRGDRHP